MKQTDTGEKKPIVMACLAGLFCILAFSLIGALGPVFVEITQGFGVAHTSFLPYIHWYWTFPLGCLVAGYLLRGSRRWSRKTSLKVDLLAIVLAVILFLVFLFSASIFMTFPGMGELREKENTAEQKP